MTGFLFLGGGLVLLYLGAEGLIRGSAALALRFGLTPLVVGLTVVAFGTSSAELVVSLDAALSGRGTIAVGNVVGSNICNIALILGVSSLIYPMKVQAQLIRLDVPIVIGCSLLMTALLLDGGVGRVEGAMLALGLVGYITFSFYQARRESPQIQETISEAAPTSERTVWVEVVLVLGGLGGLVLGADFFVQGAVIIAEALGMSQAVVSLTIVAFGTSMPELATSIVAALKKEGDLAIGNVVGSNIFNMLGILGITALVEPLQSEGVGLIDFGVMTGAVLLLLPLMRSGYRLSRWEGLLLLGIYTGYTGFLWVSMGSP